MKNINKITLLLSLLFVTYSCNEYLDVLPDNRTTVDSKEKIRKILVSAYITNNYALIPELSSDNVADYGQNNPNSTRFLGEVAYWQDITATDNDDTQSLWGGAYLAIANANEALEAINELGTEGLEAEKGEALIARAYAHFVLVNIFAKHYNKQTSGTDLGIVYMEKAEKTLNPKYKRESVKAIYEKINRDIEEALESIKGSVNPSDEQMNQIKEMAGAYSDKSQDDIFVEIIELNKKLSADVGAEEFQNKIKQIEAIRPMLNEEQNKKLDKVLEALRKSV